MALTTCTECNQEVSESASSCPKCGAKLKPSALGTLFKYLGIGISILITIGFISYASTPEYEREALSNRRICEEHLANGNRLSITWGVCQKIYNEAMDAGINKAK